MKTIHWREYVPHEDDMYLPAVGWGEPEGTCWDLVVMALKDDCFCESIYVYRPLDHPSHAERRREFIERHAAHLVESVHEWLWDEWGQDDGFDNTGHLRPGEGAHLAKLMEAPLEEAVNLYARRRTYPALELQIDEPFWVKHADLDDVMEYVQWCVDEDRSKGPLFEAMVMAAHKAAKLSEGQVSSLLNLDRISIRTRLEALEG